MLCFRSGELTTQKSSSMPGKSTIWLALARNGRVLLRVEYDQCGYYYVATKQGPAAQGEKPIDFHSKTPSTVRHNTKIVHACQVDSVMSDSMQPYGLQPARLQAMGFSRQEYWRGLPCPPPGDLPNPGIKLTSLCLPALAGGFFTTSATWESHKNL